MKRLFVGLAIEKKTASALLQAVRKMKISADRAEIYPKWIPSENYHVTVQFLGETEENLIPKIIQSLKKIAEESPALKLEIKGIDAFDSIMACRILWAGVRKTQALLDFQSKVETELVPLGFNPESREYAPHLTLAKLKNPKSLKSIVEPFLRKPFGSFVSEHVILYESWRENYISIYKPIESFKLLKRL